MGKTVGNYFELRKKHEALRNRYDTLLRRSQELEGYINEHKLMMRDHIIDQLITECEQHEEENKQLQSKISDMRKKMLYLVDTGAMDYTFLSHIFGEKEKNSFLQEFSQSKKGEINEDLFDTDEVFYF